MSDSLLEARARVLDDLAARGLDSPQCVDLVEDVVTDRRWWVEQWPEGATYVAGQVAQDVQDRCTTCDTAEPHDLHIEPELGPDPHWTCERAGVVAPLGALGTQP
jgi:TorA maturation chaperone TorD